VPCLRSHASTDKRRAWGESTAGAGLDEVNEEQIYSHCQQHHDQPWMKREWQIDAGFEGEI
jgi:hypothetical protein